MYFGFSVSIREVAVKIISVLYTHMHDFLTFHSQFILFILFSNTYLIFHFYILNVIIGRHVWILLLSSCGERVAKYVPTYILKYTHKR